MKSNALLFGLAVLLMPPAATPVFAASTWDGAYTESQASRGASLYQGTCATCHGQKLEGSGEAPPLVGRFMPDWQGTTLADMYEKIHDTMPLFAPGTLKPENTSDILAFILRSNGFPAGTATLAAGDGLKSVIFDVTKPVPQVTSMSPAKRPR